MRLPFSLAIFNLLLSSTFALMSHAKAEVYHLNPRDKGASDRNNGTSISYHHGRRGPWKTLQFAADSAKPGDTVIVHNGDYRRQNQGIVFVHRSGKESSPIRFEAATQWGPIVEKFVIHNQSWIDIQGLRFESQRFELPNNWSDMPKTVVDQSQLEINPNADWNLREQKLRKKYKTYFAVFDSLTKDYHCAIDILNSRHVAINENWIGKYCFGIQCRNNCSSIEIESNSIKYCLDGIFTWDPAPALIDSMIRGNRIRQSFSNGMQIRQGSRNVLIEDNDVRYSGTSHIAILRDAEDCQVKNNRVAFGGFYSETMKHPGSSAININRAKSGILVDGNYAAFQIDLTGKDGNGLIADLMQGGYGVTFTNNVAWRNMGSGISTVESPNCILRNNTIAENGFGRGNDRVGSAVYLATDTDQNHTITNNIFFGNAAGGVKGRRQIGQHKEIDHNLYWENKQLFSIHENPAATILSLAQARQELGSEFHGIFADPKFIKSTAEPFRSFRLRADSPAVGRAKSPSALKLGEPRTRRRNLNDLGAYQLSSDEELREETKRDH